VKKNRFDGTLGHTPLHFDHKSGRYSEKADVGVDPQQKLPPRPLQSVGMGKIQATFPTRNEQVIRAKHSSASISSSDDIDDHWDNILNNSRR
jgi:twinkle protein